MELHGPHADKPRLDLFAQFITIKRKELGYSKNGVAQYVGTSPSVIGDIEKGKYSGLKLTMMNKILAALKSTSEELGHFVTEQEEIAMKERNNNA